MRITWTTSALTRRIDRCYLVAAQTRIAQKRQHYIQLARYYRALLAGSQTLGLKLQPA